jgi:serine/threonine-protein kinase RsbW
VAGFLPAVLRLPAVLGNLRAIRSFVDEQARLVSVPQRRIDDLVLAVDEAATNIVLHGYEGRVNTASSVIEIEVQFQDHVFSVTLRDQAPPFDPTATPVVDELPPLDERGPGGLGIFLIRKSVDEFRYRRTPTGWNELTLSINHEADTQED